MFRFFIIFVLIPVTIGLQCYNDNMMPQYCSAATQYCLKADAYNGVSYRGCAYMQDCPQGQTCAPITYSSDGTTDYVCCCVGDLCNSANTKKAAIVLFVIPVIFHFFIKIFT
uniref:Uncharacterized protein n=1 Tax=Panagrolaimus sp. ES5 TaxID=591445 RepID=A0AC34GSP1_9BILA